MLVENHNIGYFARPNYGPTALRELWIKEFMLEVKQTFDKSSYNSNKFPNSNQRMANFFCLLLAYFCELRIYLIQFQKASAIIYMCT